MHCTIFTITISKKPSYYIQTVRNQSYSALSTGTRC